MDKAEVLQQAKSNWEEANAALEQGSAPFAAAKALLGIFALMIEQAQGYEEQAAPNE
jgi:hypothetical protein